MTLKQLKYIVTVAETGNITEAAGKLFIAQPSLTSAIQELEKEFDITIFRRTRKGIEITPDGEEFLGYARQVLNQADLIEERYTGSSSGKPRFCVSSQHYSFVVEAFVRLLKEFEGERYEFHVRETQTYKIIEEVARHTSEIGVLYVNEFNRTVIKKALRDNNLVFRPLFTARPHVFIGKNSPLAGKREITLEDLKQVKVVKYSTL